MKQQSARNITLSPAAVGDNMNCRFLYNTKTELTGAPAQMLLNEDCSIHVYGLRMKMILTQLLEKYPD
jgi:hypothetical protein